MKDIQLRGMKLCQGNFALKPSRDKQLSLHIDIEAHCHISPENQRNATDFIAHATFSVRLGDLQKPVLALSARVESVYTREKPVNMTEAKKRVFCDEVSNEAWPYFRTYLQSVAPFINIPMVNIPYTLDHIAQLSKDEASKSKSKKSKKSKAKKKPSKKKTSRKK